MVVATRFSVPLETLSRVTLAMRTVVPLVAIQSNLMPLNVMVTLPVVEFVRA